MKVRFFSTHESSEDLLERFLYNYVVYDNQLSFTIEEDYDYAVVFNNTGMAVKATAGVITIVQAPSWSPVFRHNRFLTDSDYVIVHDRELFERRLKMTIGGTVIESPSYMFYNDRVKHQLIDFVGSVQKVKKVSMVVSYRNNRNGNYRKRIALLNKILESDLPVDIFGYRLKIKDPRYKGEPDFKYSALIPYEYSIAIESANEKNYITEKFFDCTMYHAVPVYYGAPNIAEVYDDRFFRTIDLDSPTIIEDIRQIIAEPAPWSSINRDIYRNEFNLYTKLKEIILE